MMSQLKAWPEHGRHKTFSLPVIRWGWGAKKIVDCPDFGFTVLVGVCFLTEAVMAHSILKKIHPLRTMNVCLFLKDVDNSLYMGNY